MKKTKLETDYEALLQGIEKLSDLTVKSYEKTLEALKTLERVLQGNSQCK